MSAQSVQNRKPKQSKAQRMAGVAERALAHATKPEVKTGEPKTDPKNPKTDPKSVPVKPSTAETKPATPAPSGKEDQKGVAAPEGEKKTKKLSDTVVRWREHSKTELDMNAKIIVQDQKDWPPGVRAKRDAAADRFALYVSGMTVQQYIDASKKAGNSAALAKADVHWDLVKGFIKLK